MAAPDARSAVRARLRASLPPRAELLAGAPLWGVLMALSAAFALKGEGRLALPADAKLLALFFAAGLAGWALALPFARFFAFRRRPETRFASFLFWLMAGTIGLAALFFAVQYRSFYSQWHAPFASRMWVYQLVFTSASAAYQFAVLGLRLFLPLGFLFLLAASAIMTRRMR